MEEQQVPPSQPVAPYPVNQITPEQLAELKARAKEIAMQQALAQQTAAFAPPAIQPPQVVYVRRNLTVAELLLVLLLSCGIVTGIQWSWSFISNALPKVEVKFR
jgi:xanthine/uracil permease